MKVGQCDLTRLGVAQLRRGSEDVQHATPMDLAIWQLARRRVGALRDLACAADWGVALGSSLLSLRFGRIAVSARTTPVTRSLIAVVRRALAVLGGQRALLGRFPAMLRGTSALLGGRHHDVGAAKRRRIIVVLAGAVALCCRQIASVGGLISCRRRQITRVGDLITRVGAVQSRSSRLITVAAGQRALIGGALAYILTAVVLASIAAGREVAITGRLIFIGRNLVAVSARLIAVCTRLIGVRQRLVGVCQRLVAVGERVLVGPIGAGRVALLVSIARPIHRIDGTFA